MTEQAAPNVYDMVDQIYTALFNSPSARKDKELVRSVAQALTCIRWAIDGLETEAQTARAEAAEATNECTLLEMRLDDIADTYAAMQTGFRDISDLRQLIHA